MKKFVNQFLSVIKSRGFGRFVIGFFIFEAAWIALTASYPQAFDENFHFGLIKIYSHYWLPFLSHQPPGANTFGAVARDPSYLYHYLMSFPYRIIADLTSSQTTQIILLRFINIALFAAGLVLFKKVLLKTKLSKGLSNLIILLFALIPIVPQLAGQINYDNLLFPMVAIVCLLGFKLTDEIENKRPQFKTYMGLLFVCLSASLVKYAFLPIFLAVGCFFIYHLVKSFKPASLYSALFKDFKGQSLRAKIIFTSLVVIALTLFIQRDIVNLVRYDAIAPNCSAVMSDQNCSAYAPWQTNNNRHALVVNNTNYASKNLAYFLFQWVYWMWYRLFFAVNGPNSNFTNYPPLPLPSAITVIVALLGIGALFKYRRQLFKSNPYFLLLSLISIFYIAALIVQGFATYQFTAVLENMNGRYLVPVLFLIIAIFGRALSLFFKRNRTLGVVLACLVLLFFIEGGGILTFIQRSDQTWDFDNSSVIKVNNATRRVTSPLIIKGRSSYGTRMWFFN